MMAPLKEPQDEMGGVSRPNGLSGQNGSSAMGASNNPEGSRSSGDPDNGKAHRTPYRKSRIALRIICGMNGMCALAFGAIMMIWPTDTPMGLSGLIPLIQTMPLPAFMTETLFWPGLALLLVNGIANIVASALFFAGQPRDRAATGWALAAGILLVCWCAFEMAYLPNAASVFYLLVGIAQVALSIRLMRRRPLE